MQKRNSTAKDVEHRVCRNYVRRGQHQKSTTPHPPSTIKMTPSTPLNSPKNREYTTTKRVRFFDAWDSKEKAVSVAHICRKLDFGLAPSTARKWLRQRDIQGSPAIRRTRKQSSRLGRPAKVSASDIQRITNQQDPIHEELYEIQAKTLNGQPSACTL